MNTNITDKIKQLFELGEDAASEDEIIDSIKRGVDFRGAKLWILIIAVFVASLGLNTNSAAVIIGAMLISPLMGPIIGIGLSVGIYDFDLLRRSWRNYVIATIFSILTATVYFLITPITIVQSELLARTSPTIYDVLITLCGGLAGIIALSSRSQRTGNVIPGVAIATALMPPLCTVGFGLATANWSYAAGAFYLFLINTIFIALATFIGAKFIMQFERRLAIERKVGEKVKRSIYAIAIVTIIPAIILTVSMVRSNYFEQRVKRFIQYELHFPMTHAISHHIDYKKHSFDVVMIGQSVDSAAIESARAHLALYDLEGVDMQLIQDRQSVKSEELILTLQQESHQLDHAEAVIEQQQQLIDELKDELASIQNAQRLSQQLLQEAQLLFPRVQCISTARGTTSDRDTTYLHDIVVVNLSNPLSKDEAQKLDDWLNLRIGGPEPALIIQTLK